MQETVSGMLSNLINEILGEAVSYMPSIDGVKMKSLHYIADERGRLLEILRKDDEFYIKFGQVYITTAYPGVIKAGTII